MISGARSSEGEPLFKASVEGSLYTLCRQVFRTWDLSRGVSLGRRLLQKNKVTGWGTSPAQGTPSKDNTSTIRI